MFCCFALSHEIEASVWFIDPNHLILNKVKGRTSEDQITLFDSTGMALLDLATAEIALQLAEKTGLGTKAKI
ncbi:MAG TPA: hypothetical protein GX523_16210 [Desulfitobacterium dehalogenans]|uniref:Uncharacterized protein n=1 Tax=Desulfitobacterium dehalogenans TaxID=36854 RepID=A0A7C6Z6G0_9FIRM|nr:hypothetical protein [Desulfitobacterium dehalogenans]